MHTCTTKIHHDTPVELNEPSHVNHSHGSSRTIQDTTKSIHQNQALQLVSANPVTEDCRNKLLEDRVLSHVTEYGQNNINIPNEAAGNKRNEIDDKLSDQALDQISKMFKR